MTTMTEQEQAEHRALRDALANQQREVERLREENARMQKRMSVLEQTVQGEVEERRALIATIARAQSQHEPPVHEWPTFPENTMVQILTTNMPTGVIAIAICEGDTPIALAKRLVDAAASAKRTSKATVGR